MSAILSARDSTITRVDVAEPFLGRFTGEASVSVEATFRAKHTGHTGPRQAVARQFALVRAGREEMFGDVFVRGHLADLRRLEGARFEPFETFANVLREMSG